jgi:hypothetical protein
MSLSVLDLAFPFLFDSFLVFLTFTDFLVGFSDSFLSSGMFFVCLLELFLSLIHHFFGLTLRDDGFVKSDLVDFSNHFIQLISGRSLFEHMFDSLSTSLTRVTVDIDTFLLSCDPLFVNL